MNEPIEPTSFDHLALMMGWELSSSFGDDSMMTELPDCPNCGNQPDKHGEVEHARGCEHEQGDLK